jgi:hypothetical protein
MSRHTHRLEYHMAATAVSTPFALLGAGIGAGATVATALLVGISLPAAGIAAAVAGGVVIIAYIVAAFTAGSSCGEVLRGLMIGINSGLNFAFAYLLLSLALGKGHPAALGIAIGLGAVNFTTVFSALSQNDVYQGFIGYLNWCLPMSWPIIALGLVFTLLNVLGGLCIGLPGVEFFKLKEFDIDWKTGTLFIKGGWVSNANPIDTAYNMGNFSFVDAAYTGMAMDHEAGHTLNLAAFGSVFHLVGALDENVIRNGANALSERLAESNVPSTSSPTLAMWN